MPSPKPQQPAPELSIDLVDGGRWNLAEHDDHTYVLLAFYRGRHCPICGTHLAELAALRDRISALDTFAIAVSMNDRTLATSSQTDWEVGGLPIGYGLTEQQARQWGLYLSTAIRPTEPDLFCEPATYLVECASGTIYMAAVQSSPHLRLQWPRVVRAIERAHEGYPARGAA